jgi:hypothetical protein
LNKLAKLVELPKKDLDGSIKSYMLLVEANTNVDKC